MLIEHAGSQYRLRITRNNKLILTKVLDGLDYVSDGRGLVPSDAVTAWVERQIETLERAPFRATSAR